MTKITYDGYPVVMTLEYRTEPGEGWAGTAFLGEYTETQALNDAIYKYAASTPVGWRLHIEFQDVAPDKLTDPCDTCSCTTTCMAVGF